MKFKVGDKVRIIVTPQMYKLIGTIINISSPYGVLYYTVISNDTYYLLHEHTLEPYYDTHSILQEILDE